MSNWDEKQLKEHYDKHSKNFTNIGSNVKIADEKDYESKSKEYLKKFDRVFLFYESGSGKHGLRVNFVNTKDNVMVGVDMNDYRISTFFPINQKTLDKYTSEYMEIVK